MECAKCCGRSAAGATYLRGHVSDPLRVGIDAPRLARAGAVNSDKSETLLDSIATGTSPPPASHRVRGLVINGLRRTWAECQTVVVLWLNEIRTAGDRGNEGR